LSIRGLLRVLVIIVVLTPLCAGAIDHKLMLELNSIEPIDHRCRLNFVIENRSERGIDSMKLDLVAFGTDGGILRRLLTEMAPVRPAKTVVRSFLVDAECGQLGAILVNDVTSCAPGEPGVCLDGLVLSSRLQSLRFYK
jgi:hypothetical protein